MNLLEPIRAAARAWRPPGRSDPGEPAHLRNGGPDRSRFVRVVDRHALWLVPGLHVLLWGLYAFLRRPVGDYGVETDFFGDYVPWSRAWMLGHPGAMSGFKGPVYYLLLGAGSRVATLFTGGGHYPPPPGIEFAVGKLLSALAAAAALWGIGRVARRLLPSVSVWGTLAVQVVVATNLDFIDHTYRAGTDMVSLALLVLTLWISVAARSRRAVLGLGMTAAAAYLTRYSNLALLPGALLFLVIGDRGRVRRLTAISLCLVGFVGVCLPWWGLLWRTTGDPFYNRNVLNAAYEVFGIDRIPIDAFMAANLPLTSWADLFRADAGAVTATMARNVPGHLYHDGARLLGWPVAVLCLAGWVLALVRPGDRRAWLAMAGTAGFVFLSLLPIFYGSRFALPMLPLCALGVAGLWRAWRRPWPRSTRVVAAVLLAAGLAAGYARGLARAEDPDRFYQPREVLTLRDDLAARGVTLDHAGPVAARKPHVAYWLALPLVAAPSGETIARVVDELRSSGARYLYVGSSEMVQRPALAPLADPRAPRETPAGLRRLGVGVHRMGNRLVPGVLYEVLDPGPPPPLPRAGRPAGPAVAGVGRTALVKFSLGRLSLQHGQREMALPLLLDAARRAPTWPWAQEWAGDALFVSGRREEAGLRYQTATDLAPGSASAWCRLAAVDLAADRKEEADRLCRKAAGLAATDPVALGVRFFEEREFGAAIGPLTLAIGGATTDWRVWHHLGWIEWNIMGDGEQAERHLAECAHIMPAGPDLQQVDRMLQDIRSTHP